MITVEDVIRVAISKDELNKCIDNAKAVLKNLVDRNNLHSRDDLERFNNILMGEIAEYMVIKWICEQGKRAKSSVDKNSGIPDIGHDIELIKNDNSIVKCSVKSSLSFSKGLSEIVNEFKLATTEKELRDVNVQVYFWLNLHPQPDQSRITVSSLNNSAIIGWFGKKDLMSFEKYNHEQRQAPIKSLIDARPMSELLKLIK